MWLQHAYCYCLLILHQCWCVWRTCTRTWMKIHTSCSTYTKLRTYLFSTSFAYYYSSGSREVVVAGDNKADYPDPSIALLLSQGRPRGCVLGGECLVLEFSQLGVWILLLRLLLSDAVNLCMEWFTCDGVTSPASLTPRVFVNGDWTSVRWTNMRIQQLKQQLSTATNQQHTNRHTTNKAVKS